MRKVLNMTDGDILNKIVESSYRYRDNLLDKNMIIISYNRKVNHYSYIECEFLDKHFQHLTGVKIRPYKGAPTYNPDMESSANFFDACINNRLKMSDYRNPNDGTVELKMVVIMEVLTFMYTTKNMMGSFLESKDRLFTEKLVGNVRGSIGFVNDKEKPGSLIKVPNTILNVDIKKQIKEANGIVCIFEKVISDEKYNVLKYIKIDKPKKKGGKIISKPVDFLLGIKELEIVKAKVDSTFFELNEESLV